MLYHLSKTNNKESILKNGLEGGHRLRRIYLARSVFDAFILAPPLVEYFYTCKACATVAKQFNAFFLNWQKDLFKISLFFVYDDDVTVREKSNASLEYFCKSWGIPYNEAWENRTLMEYITEDNISPDKVHFVCDYELMTWTCCALDKQELEARVKEYMELRAQGYNNGEAEEAMKKKYVPQIDVWLPPL